MVYSVSRFTNTSYLISAGLTITDDKHTIALVSQVGAVPDNDKYI